MANFRLPCPKAWPNRQSRTDNTTNPLIGLWLIDKRLRLTNYFTNGYEKSMGVVVPAKMFDSNVRVVHFDVAHVSQGC